MEHKPCRQLHGFVFQDDIAERLLFVFGFPGEFVSLEPFAFEFRSECVYKERYGSLFHKPCESLAPDEFVFPDGIAVQEPCGFWFHT